MGRPRRVLTPDKSPAHLWGAELRVRRDQAGWSPQELADRTRYDASYLARAERGDQFASRALAEACDEALGAGGELLRLWASADHELRRAAAGADSEAASEGVISDVERRLVAVMPLHAITTSYGEAGLRARFGIEVQRVLPAAARDDAARALELAAGLHAADRRQREPYVNHLLRVALRVMHHYGVSDPEVICAALLHDAVEDHAEALAAGGRREDAVAALAVSFGARTAGLVDAVTNPPRDPSRDRHEQYRAHVVASLEADPWARVLKLSDITDNGVGLHYTTGPKAARLVAKYAPLVPALATFAALPDTPLSAAAKTRIVSQLLNAQARFAALAGGDAQPGK